jgi:hypothetical protein
MARIRQLGMPRFTDMTLPPWRIRGRPERIASGLVVKVVTTTNEDWQRAKMPFAQLDQARTRLAANRLALAKHRGQGTMATRCKVLYLAFDDLAPF